MALPGEDLPAELIGDRGCGVFGLFGVGRPDKRVLAGPLKPSLREALEFVLELPEVWHIEGLHGGFDRGGVMVPGDR
ncbi:MAG: hypothetical protein F4086_08505, partial [Gemmatimonadetes bacterium]|nr:hypothetical protein [Gemmatimonadota bacterium]MYJ10342.1 hypothetical protein [Gemmatimonadota bacterium]